MANIRIDSNGRATHLYIDGHRIGVGIEKMLFSAVGGEDATMELKINVADFQVETPEQLEHERNTINNIEATLKEAEFYKNARKEEEESEKVQ